MAITIRSASEALRGRGKGRRYRWAELLQRVFLVDVLACPCGGRRKVLSAIHDPDSIRRVLALEGRDRNVGAFPL